MIVFPNDAFFKQKHLRAISEDTFRQKMKSKLAGLCSALIAIYFSFINRYIRVDVSLTAALG